MTFEDVKNDIIKLIGLDLESIKPGAEIRILSVDLQQGNLQLRTASDTSRSRPLDELERIWNELQKSPAVHVESVLKGSGTSRNQPETILANLPYIEWTKIHNKKHLVFVNESTHAFGTLKMMDAEASAILTAKIDESIVKHDVSLIVVSSDIKSAIESFQETCGGVVNTMEQGVYVLESNACSIAFITPSQSGLAPGTYPIVEASNINVQNKGVSVIGKELIPFVSGDIKVLIKRQ